MLNVKLQKDCCVIDDGNKLRVFYKNHETLLVHEEGIYFLAWTYGVKLYNLNEFFEVKWSQQVMPYYVWRGGASPIDPYGQEKLAIDENQNIYVAYEIDRELFIVWEKHFEKVVQWQEGAGGILLTRFSENGMYFDSRIFWGKHPVFILGLHVQNNATTIGGNVRVENKFTRPNDTSEWDLLFLKANFLTGENIDYKMIDIKREDHALDFHVDENGIGIFAGTNDFLQMDTNSLVEFGQGFILKVNGHGETINYLPLRLLRHTGINTIALLPKENPSSSFQEIIFGGTYNGPITHTVDVERFKESMLGVLKW